MNAKWLMILLSIVTVAYPVIVYFGLQHFSPSAVAALLLLLILTRLLLVKSKTAPWVKTSLIMAGLVLGLSALSNSSALMRFYPVVINLSMLGFFALSLIKPPSVIETLARLSDPQLPDSAIPYTKNVTKAWCLFFAFNGFVAAYTAVFMSLESWTIYNGFVSYILIGLMFGVEYLIRRKVKAKHRQNESNGGQA